MTNIKKMGFMVIFFIIYSLTSSNKLMADDMDFSGIILESSEIDEESEKKEEEEIEKKLDKNQNELEKKGVLLEDIQKKKPKPIEKGLVFLLSDFSMEYHNFALFDNLHTSHLFFTSFETSMFGLKIENFRGELATVGYQFSADSDFNSLVITPLKGRYNFIYETLPLYVKLSLFKTYVFSQVISGYGGSAVRYLYEFFSITGGYTMYSDRYQNWNIYLSFGFAPDDVDTNEISLFFSLGLEIDLPILNI
ncbi:hypothetical protein JXR93_11685, partial [bacterium]|nr:hypothetical protein [bacterium]